jgi:hypothetical protein
VSSTAESLTTRPSARMAVATSTGEYSRPGPARRSRTRSSANSSASIPNASGVQGDSHVANAFFSVAYVCGRPPSNWRQSRASALRADRAGGSPRSAAKTSAGSSLFGSQVALLFAGAYQDLLCGLTGSVAPFAEVDLQSAMKRPFPIYRWPPRVKPTSPSGNVEYCEGEDEPGASDHEPPAARAAKMGPARQKRHEGQPADV